MNISKNDVQNFRHFLNLIHNNRQAGNVYTLTRKIGADGYMRTTQQCWDITEQDRIIKYIIDNALENDFSITPAIFNKDESSFGRNESSVSELYCLWAEFDYGNTGHKNKNQAFQTKAECIKTIRHNYAAYGIPPNIVFSSGHGIHCYWLTHEDVFDNNDADIVKELNELIFQIGINAEGRFYNEVKNAASMMRTSIPAINRKIPNEPVPTVLKIMHQNRYDYNDLVDVLEEFEKSVFIKKKPAIKQADINDLQLFGDIDAITKDKEFMDWASDSRDWNRLYGNGTYEPFDSSSHKESYIFCYLYRCGLDEHEILDFVKDHFDMEYHINRTRKQDSDKLNLIRYNIDKAISENYIGKIRIKENHLKEVLL